MDNNDLTTLTAKAGNTNRNPFLMIIAFLSEWRRSWENSFKCLWSVSSKILYWISRPWNLLFLIVSVFILYSIHAWDTPKSWNGDQTAHGREAEFRGISKLSYVEQTGLLKGALINVELQNVDGWLIDRGIEYSELRDEGLTKEDLQIIKNGNRPDINGNLNPEYAEAKAKFDKWYSRILGELRLMIGGQFFDSIKVYNVTGRAETKGNDSSKEVVFRLEPGANDRENWNDLIRTFGSQYHGDIGVSLKIGAGQHLWLVTKPDLEGKSFIVMLRPRLMLALSWIVFSALVMFVIQLGINTEVLRTSGMTSPWSLSRVVLAWWLTIISGCFLLLWALTGQYNNVSDTVLALLGINGTTLVISSAIDGYDKSNSSRGKLSSRGFFSDLVSEAGSAEVARLQMLVWNCIFGVVFFWQTTRELKMPVFDSTLMALLGISSGAYVSFKKFGTKGGPVPPETQAADAGSPAVPGEGVAGSIPSK